ncbi:chemotaxis protein CheV [Desulfobacter latus]|uniref:Chemotaxis protein CheV n=1 Tax=Desulfobacter latus TaxID=2292 RepID=A0A850SUX4_9BACT|nr:chemotaxis protein [Desulfobacter latus]NWH05164.1 chemotaxis protein CheV [Desulfobacter latus]
MASMNEPDSYLKSGSNELKILEYKIGKLHLGINILKVSRVINRPEQYAGKEANMHAAVMGMFYDHGAIVPLVDLSVVLGLESDDGEGRVIITEFFNTITGFWVNAVEQVHTISWEQVKDTKQIMGSLDNPYILAIARPDQETNILLADYEKIVLELSPSLAAKPDDQGITTELKGDGQLILVAEDSAPVRQMLETELSERNLKVITARDGEMAIDLFDENPDIALVIADVEMPKKDGLSVLGHIRNDPDRNRTPVLVYSSIGDIGMKERAKAMKANAHITKLSLDELLRQVAHLLKL